jgi:hypothetical protein
LSRGLGAFDKALEARCVNQNPAHQPRRHRDEVNAILSLNLLHIDEPQVPLID